MKNWRRIRLRKMSDAEQELARQKNLRMNRQMIRICLKITEAKDELTELKGP